MGAGTGVDLNVGHQRDRGGQCAGRRRRVNVAAQFTFGGRTYLAINQDGAFTTFTDISDLLVDITGVTGAIATSNFI